MASESGESNQSAHMEASQELTAEQRNRIVTNRWTAFSKRYCKENGSNLSQAQQEAVGIMGHAIIRAGPGSGKTLVLLHRVALLMRQGISPEMIAAVTFTNKAADELRDRLEVMCPASAGRIFTGTFHSLAACLLREAGVRVSVIDENERGELVKKAAAVEGHVLDARSAVTWLQEGDASQAVNVEYNRLLDAMKLVDYDRLICRATATADQNGCKWSHVLVDEAQDCSEDQLCLIETMKCTVFAVGDQDQRIYSWRNNTVSDLQNAFAKIMGERTSSVRLMMNWRCSPSIVKVAEHVVSEVHAMPGKPLE